MTATQSGAMRPEMGSALLGQGVDSEIRFIPAEGFQLHVEVS